MPSSVCSSDLDRKSTRLNSSHLVISYALFCLGKNGTPAATPRQGNTPPPRAAEGGGGHRAEGRRGAGYGEQYGERHDLGRLAVWVVYYDDGPPPGHRLPPQEDHPHD